MTEQPSRSREVHPPPAGVSRSPDGPRLLRAVLAIDACGYSRWVRDDEDAALAALAEGLDRMRDGIAAFGGEACAACGDGLIATFASARQAVACAQRLQTATGAGPLRFRAGIHLGDTRRVGGQVLGDSVNVAARIQAVALPGGIIVSRPVFDALRSQADLDFRALGRPALKHIGADLELFVVEARADAAAAGTHAAAGGVAAPPVRDPTGAAAEAAGFAIALMPARVDPGDGRAAICADLVGDWLARCLTEIEAVEIHDYRLPGGRGGPGDPGDAVRAAGPDLLVWCRCLTVGTAVQVAIVALRAEDRTVIWTGSASAEASAFGAAPGAALGPFVARAADALLSALTDGRHLRDPAAQLAAKTSIGAVHHLLTMTGPGLARLERDIAAAHALDPKPIYLGWLAYMTTFRIGERLGARDRELQDRARHLARAALDADPHNSLVLGLTAHVHSYVLRDFATAEDLLQRASDINPFRAVLWDSASLLYSYTGRARQARRAAHAARRLGRHSPYRHLFDGAACVAAAAGGRFAEAVRYGEGVIAVQPEFKAVLRYLAASHGHLGNRQRARALLDRLARLEPDLSVERLRDDSYPVPTPRCEELIESGLRKVGLPQHV